MTEEGEISRRSQEALSTLHKSITTFLRHPKTKRRAQKQLGMMFFLCTELLLTLDFPINARKVTPTCCFPTGHPIQSAHFPEIEVNALGKPSPSVIIETDLEFRRQIIIWHSLLPKTSLSSCRPFSLAFLIWWQRLMEGDRLSLNGLFCPHRFALFFREEAASRAGCLCAKCSKTERQDEPR